MSWHKLVMVIFNLWLKNDHCLVEAGVGLAHMMLTNFIYNTCIHFVLHHHAMSPWELIIQLTYWEWHGLRQLGSRNISLIWNCSNLLLHGPHFFLVSWQWLHRLFSKKYAPNFSSLRTQLFSSTLVMTKKNITTVICTMLGATGDLAALDFVLDKAMAGKPLKQTIVFFNTRELCLQEFKYLCAQLPMACCGKINHLHDLWTQNAKCHVMKNFQSGKIVVLCATEVALQQAWYIFH